MQGALWLWVRQRKEKNSLQRDEGRWRKEGGKISSTRYGSSEKAGTDNWLSCCVVPHGGERFFTGFEPAEPLWWIRAPLAVGNDLYPVWLMKQFHSWSMCLAASSRTKHWFWILTWESVKMFSQPNAKGKAAVEQPSLRDTHFSVCLAFNYDNLFFTKVNFSDFQLYFKIKANMQTKKSRVWFVVFTFTIHKKMNINC